MIYDLSDKETDIKLTQVQMESEYEPDHQYIQFVENYFRSMYRDNLDMSKLKFYKADPAKGGSEISADQATDQIRSGYPLFVKHEEIADIVPIMKRGQYMYTGQDILNQHRHMNPIEFDIEAFKKETEPEAPNFFESFIAIFGIKTDRYKKHNDYVKKAEALKKNKVNLEKYNAEADAYKYAEEIGEYDSLADEFKQVEADVKAAGPVVKAAKVVKEAAKPAEAKQEAEKSDALPEDINADELENLNIGQLLPPEEKKTYSDKNGPSTLTEDQEEEYKSRIKSTDQKVKMRSSEFMGVVKKEILKGKYTGDELENMLEGMRHRYYSVGSATTKEYIEYAKVQIMVDGKRAQADKANEKFENYQLTFNAICDTIADELVKVDHNLDRDDVIKTVRFGPTIKEMTSTPEKTSELAKLVSENPAELGRRYMLEVNKAPAVEADNEPKVEHEISHNINPGVKAPENDGLSI